MAINYANVLVIVFATYFTLYFFKLIVPKNRRGIKLTNQAMDKIRDVPIKTVDEQKRFLDIKYPRRGKFRWSVKIIPKFLMNIIFFIAIFQGYNMLFVFWNISLRIWQGILFVMILPIIINLILERFDLQKGDLRRMLR